MSEQIKDKKRMSVAERRETRKKKVERLDDGGVTFPKKRLYTYKGVTKEITDKQIEKIKNRALAWGESEFRKNPKRLERYKAQLNQYTDTLKSGEADLNVIGAEAERNLFDRITNPEEYAGYIFSQAINEGFGFKSDGSKSDATIEAEQKAAAEAAKTNANLFTERLISDIYKGNKSNYDADLKYLEGDEQKSYTIGLDDRMQKVADVIKTFEGYSDFALDGADADANYKKIMDASRALGLTTADVQKYLTPTKPKSKSDDGTSTTSTQFTAISDGLNPDWAKSIGDGISFTEDNPEWTKSQGGNTRYGKVKSSNGTAKWVVFQKGENGQWGYSNTVTQKQILKREGNSVLYSDENGNIQYIKDYTDTDTDVPPWLYKELNNSKQTSSLTMSEQGVRSEATTTIDGESIDLSSVVNNQQYAIYKTAKNGVYAIVTYDKDGKGTISDKVIYTNNDGALSIGTVTKNKNSTKTIKDDSGTVVEDGINLELKDVLSAEEYATPEVTEYQPETSYGFSRYKVDNNDFIAGEMDDAGDFKRYDELTQAFPNLANYSELNAFMNDVGDKYEISDDRIFNYIQFGQLPKKAKRNGNIKSTLSKLVDEFDERHIETVLSNWLAYESTEGDGAIQREQAQFQLLYIRHLIGQYAKLIYTSDTDNMTRINTLIERANSLLKVYNKNPNTKIGPLKPLEKLATQQGASTDAATQTQSEKQGGTIKHLQDGGGFELDEETIARLNAQTEKANNEYKAKKAKEEAERKEREAWLADPKNKAKFRFGGDKNKGNQGSWGLRETGQAVATGLDVLSAAGGAVGCAAALASTAIDAVADFTDDTLTTKEKWIRFGTNLAFTGAALIPFARAAYSAYKVGKAAKGVARTLDIGKAAKALNNNKSLAQAVADRANQICGSSVTASQAGQVLRRASTFWSSAWRGVKGVGSSIGKGIGHAATATATSKGVQNTIKTAMYIPLIPNGIDAWNSIQNGDGLTMSQLRSIASPILSRWVTQTAMKRYNKGITDTIEQLFPSPNKTKNVKVKFTHQGKTHEVEVPYSVDFTKSDYKRAAREQLANSTDESLAAMQRANKKVKWNFWDTNDITVDKQSLKEARSAANTVEGYSTEYLKSLMTDENLSSAQRTVLNRLTKSGALSQEEINFVRNFEKQLDNAANFVQRSNKGFSGSFTTKEVGHTNALKRLREGMATNPLPSQKAEVWIPSRWKRPTLTGEDAISFKNVSYNKKGGSLSFEQRVYLKNLDAQNRASVNTTKTFIEDLKLLAKKAENAEKGFRQERLLILKGLK